MGFVMIGARGQEEHDALVRLVNEDFIKPIRTLDIPPDSAPSTDVVVETDWRTMKERILGEAVIGVKFSRTITICQADSPWAAMRAFEHMRRSYPAELGGMWIQRLSDPAKVPETCPHCGRAYR